MNNKCMKPTIIAKYLLDTDQEKDAIVMWMKDYSYYGDDTRMDILDALLEGSIQKCTLDSCIANNIFITSAKKRDIKLFNLCMKYNFNMHFDNDALLKRVVKRNNDTMVKILLENGVSVCTCDEILWICVEYVSIDSTCKTLQLLLEYGAIVDTHHDRILEHCIKQNAFNACKLLIEYGARVNFSDIKKIILTCDSYQRVEILQHLIDTDPSFDIEYDITWDYAIETDNEGLISLLIKNNPSACLCFDNMNLALKSALANGNLDIVKLLIEHGADIRAINLCDVAFNLEYYSIGIISIMIAHGVDPSMGNNFMVKCAVEYWRCDIVKELIDHGLCIQDLEPEIINKIEYMLM